MILMTQINLENGLLNKINLKVFLLLNNNEYRNT